MTARRTRAKELRRGTASRPERKTVVVFCEGAATEPDYIRALKRLPNIRDNTAINIEIAPRQGVPFTLVKLAVERAADDEVDECWCVFDVEWPKHHPNLDRALSLADQHDIKLAISNPCFELWLILHLDDHTSFIETKPADQLSRELDGRAGKHIDGDQYMPHRHTAARRAAALVRQHDQAGTEFPDDNPSSTMYEFLAAIEPAVRSAERNTT